jgi:hypothetical protein
MTGWYAITPAGTVAIGNLTPVGQNSGQVGCRWPPNGHQLAACLNLPKDCQLWGPFWYFGGNIYVTLPLTAYRLVSPEAIPQEIFRMQWQNEQWGVHPKHQGKEIEIVGGRYLIAGNSLQTFWKTGLLTNAPLQELPWRGLTLSQNSREDFQVKDEGGFFAEMTTLMNPGWSILVKVIGSYTPPNSNWSFLGAGGTPVVITPVRVMDNWLEVVCPNPTGAILLTAALWQRGTDKVSIPYPPLGESIKAYAAEMGVPWQSWKRVPDRGDREKKVQVLTPGEWITPAGAVYLWKGVAPLQKSAPLPDNFYRHVLGYGHLWLFEE